MRARIANPQPLASNRNQLEITTLTAHMQEYFPPRYFKSQSVEKPSLSDITWYAAPFMPLIRFIRYVYAPFIGMVGPGISTHSWTQKLSGRAEASTIAAGKEIRTEAVGEETPMG